MISVGIEGGKESEYPILVIIENEQSLDSASAAMTTSALFRKAKQKALVEDLHFHDTRHEGITRLAKKLDVLALARAIGHRDLKMLLVYYNESAADMAKRL